MFMSDNFIEKILTSYNIEFKAASGKYYFRHKDIDFWTNNEGLIGVNSEFFGLIPHVMPNGEICISGNSHIRFKDKDTEVFYRTINIYAPWLFNLPPSLKVAEMLTELEFFIIAYLGVRCKVNKLKFLPDKFTTKIVLNPEDLWNKINDLELGIWYKMYPFEHNNQYVFIQKNSEGYHVVQDYQAKAKMRVSGLYFNTYNAKSAFIGVGSVNSYVIKAMFSKGMNNIILIDDDRVTVDNMFRFAFPYPGKMKVDAVEYFLKATSSNINVTKNKKRISDNSKDMIIDAEVVYVSVDSYMSWLTILKYLCIHLKSGVLVYLVGVDAFGGYGKFISIKYEGNIPDLIEKFLSFLDYKRSVDEERLQMIGNGCGKSIAVYSELDLLKLSDAVSTNIILGEIIHVDF